MTLLRHEVLIVCTNAIAPLDSADQQRVLQALLALFEPQEVNPKSLVGMLEERADAVSED